MAGENLIQVGAQFNGSGLDAGVKASADVVKQQLVQMQAAFDGLKATTTARINEVEAKLAEMEESFRRHGARSSEAMHSMGLSAEATGVTINRHMRSVINELPLLSKAFELAFPAFALTAGVEIVQQFGEKISEL